MKFIALERRGEKYIHLADPKLGGVTLCHLTAWPVVVYGKAKVCQDCGWYLDKTFDSICNEQLHLPIPLEP